MGGRGRTASAATATATATSCAAADRRKEAEDSYLETFKVGTAVEVSSEDEGLRGSWYSATVLTPLSRESLKIQVQYHNLMLHDSPCSSHLREFVNALLVRPIPPVDPTPAFRLMDDVDAFHNDGWWEGVVTLLHPHHHYSVFFRSSREQIRFPASQIRLHREWLPPNPNHWAPPLNSPSSRSPSFPYYCFLILHYTIRTLYFVYAFLFPYSNIAAAAAAAAFFPYILTFGFRFCSYKRKNGDDNNDNGAHKMTKTQKRRPAAKQPTIVALPATRLLINPHRPMPMPMPALPHNNPSLTMLPRTKHPVCNNGSHNKPKLTIIKDPRTRASTHTHTHTHSGGRATRK